MKRRRTPLTTRFVGDKAETKPGGTPALSADQAIDAAAVIAPVASGASATSAAAMPPLAAIADDRQSARRPTAAAEEAPAAPAGEAAVRETGEPPELDALAAEIAAVVPFVRRVVWRRLRSFHRGAAEDVVQRVLLGLWHWRIRHARRKLPAAELEKLAARAARNGVAFYYRQYVRKTLPLVEQSFDESRAGQSFDPNDVWRSNASGDGNEFENDLWQVPSCAGDTPAEARSLALFSFEQVKRLSLRQRFALVLQKSDVIVQLLLNYGCNSAELAAVLQLDHTEFAAVARRLPLTDAEIAQVWQAKTNEPLTAKQVWEARARARARLRRALNDPLVT